jgi:hypothetical protein
VVLNSVLIQAIYWRTGGQPFYRYDGGEIINVAVQTMLMYSASLEGQGSIQNADGNLLLNCTQYIIEEKELAKLIYHNNAGSDLRAVVYEPDAASYVFARWTNDWENPETATQWVNPGDTVLMVTGNVHLYVLYEVSPAPPVAFQRIRITTLP